MVLRIKFIRCCLSYNNYLTPTAVSSSQTILSLTTSCRHCAIFPPSHRSSKITMIIAVPLASAHNIKKWSHYLFPPASSLCQSRPTYYYHQISIHQYSNTRIPTYLPSHLSTHPLTYFYSTTPPHHAPPQKPYLMLFQLSLSQTSLKLLSYYARESQKINYVPKSSLYLPSTIQHTRD